MNNIYRTISLPILLEIGDDKRIRLDDILKSHNLIYPNKILISSKRIYQKYKKYLEYDTNNIFFVNTPNLDEINSLIKKINNLPKESLLVGFGGGKIIDIVKYIGLKTGLNFISIPSALSHDGICSPIAVLSQNDGMKIRVGTPTPLGVIVNTNIIQQAPIETTVAGIGDLLSNISALKDWKLAKKDKGEQIDNFAYALSYLSYNDIFNYLKTPHLNLKDKKFLKNLAYALIISGFSMDIAGSSRPCSGSEHLFSHSIDYFYAKKSTLHGVQVAIGTLIAESLRGEEIKEIVKIYKNVGLPSTIREIGFKKEEILYAIKKAPEMNINRYTILNKFELTDRLIEKRILLLL